jgi:anti-sigma factor ChrR (cupin superfamily)
VDTPVVPPRPDVVLLVDGTGSMQPTIDGIRRDLSAVTGQVRQDQPDARFAVATFGDQQVDGDRVFTVLQGLTSDMSAVQAGVDALTADRGFGSPGPSEDWINALWQIAGGAGGRIAFRQEASPVVVLVGDASSHDPSNGHTLGDATGALQNAGIRVLAVDVATELGDGLNGNGDNGNGPGQNGEPTHEPNEASTVVNASGGKLLENIEPNEVARAIGDGLTNLPTTVTYQTVGCDPALQVTLDPASRTVTSGDPARFEETIHAVGDAPQGTELTCAVQFLLDGKVPGGNAPDVVTEDQLSRRTRSPLVRPVPAGTGPTGKGPYPDSGTADTETADTGTSGTGTTTGRTTLGIGVGAAAGTDGNGGRLIFLHRLQRLNRRVCPSKADPPARCGGWGWRKPSSRGNCAPRS